MCTISSALTFLRDYAKSHPLVPSDTEEQKFLSLSLDTLLRRLDLDHGRLIVVDSPDDYDAPFAGLIDPDPAPEMKWGPAPATASSMPDSYFEECPCEEEFNENTTLTQPAPTLKKRILHPAPSNVILPTIPQSTHSPQDEQEDAPQDEPKAAPQDEQEDAPQEEPKVAFDNPFASCETLYSASKSNQTDAAST